MQRTRDKPKIFRTKAPAVLLPVSCLEAAGIYSEEGFAFMEELEQPP